MPKTNWRRVFLGGLLAGIVLNVLDYIAMAIYLDKLWASALEASGHPVQETIGNQVLWIVTFFVMGILAVWFYSAIRPRYGAGPKTAVIAGLGVWVLRPLSFAVTSASFGLFPSNVLVIDSLTALVMYIVATLAGAWVYKEQSQ